MKSILIAAVIFAAVNGRTVGAAVNPMDNVPTLIVKNCPTGHEWAIEDGGVGFCRASGSGTAPVVRLDQIPPPPIATPAVAENTALTAPVDAAPSAATPVATSSTAIAPVVVADSGTTRNPLASSRPAPPLGPLIGATCNGTDWMTQRQGSDGRTEWLYVPAWMNHD